MDWVASTLQLLGMFLVGRKSVWGWVVLTISIVPWWMLMLEKHIWGMIPLNLVSIVIYTINLYDWHKGKAKA